MGILYCYTYNLLLPLLAFLLFFITPRLALILLFILGIITAAVHQWLNSPLGFPAVQVIPQAVVVGTIASLPVRTANKTQFNVAVESLNHHPAQGLIQIAWYNNAPIIHALEKWQFTVKLKKPRNFLNPGSYDYVNTLASRHIQWTGYVKSQNNRLIQHPDSRFDWLQMRESISRRLTYLSPNKRTDGVIQALTLNLTNQIGQEQWDLFRRTGTTHLFGISGEHIAFISGLIFWLTKRMWSRSLRLSLRIPSLYVASVSGLSVAFLYSLLAGFAPPVQRALIGCFFYTVCCLGKQRFTIWQVWRYALFTVLVLEPHAVFMQGFYFSFLAAACLILCNQRWPLKGFKATLLLQGSCLIGLMPLTLFWYSYGSINGYIANLFAIPLVGLIIVPLCLLTMLFCNFSWSWILMSTLNQIIDFMFLLLNQTERLAGLNLTVSISSIEWVLALTGSLLLFILLPIKPFKQLAFLGLLLPFFPQRTVIQPGEALVQVLDVGQGLAVSIRTAKHNLLYDTGDQFFKGSDLGKMVILPFYNRMQVNTIDKIIISHPDKDHRGGLKSIEETLPVDELLVNDRRFYHRGLRCHDYPSWQWDGVIFRFFSIRQAFKGKNNSSCILKVSSASGSALFTGDIEQLAEDYLVKTYGESLKSDVLIIPHHGSKTSSSYRFLLEVAPRFAIASLGFDNRFRFPHAKTVNALKSLDIDFYRTDECGMTEFYLPRTGPTLKPHCFN